MKLARAFRASPKWCLLIPLVLIAFSGCKSTEDFKRKHYIRAEQPSTQKSIALGMLLDKRSSSKDGKLDQKQIKIGRVRRYDFKAISCSTQRVPLVCFYLR